jgi:cytochrome c oxidase subunit 4
MSVQHHEEEHSHPGWKTYTGIAIILAIITALEIGTYYIEDTLGAALVWILLFLSVIKFVLVVGWYMHLKFDNKLFTWLFGFGMAVAISVILSFLVLFDRLW